MKHSRLWSVLLLAACNASLNPTPCPKGICVGGGDGGAQDLATGACVESWSCTPWTAGAGGMYTRACTDNNRCGTTAARPTEGPIALPALDLDYYECKVEPILDRGCAMMDCHGTAAGDNVRAFRVFARGRRRNNETVAPLASCLESGPQNLQKMGSGTVMCHGWTAHTDTEWQMNFDSARAQLLGLSDPELCDLLLQPVVGGKSHSGVHLFRGKSDPDYQTIKSWLSGAKLGSTCAPLN